MPPSVNAAQGKKKRGRPKKSEAAQQPKKKRQSSKVNQAKTEGLNVIADDGDAIFYEAETVVDARQTKDGEWLYRVRWVNYGPEEDTWEPEAHLCDSLYEVARSFRVSKCKKDGIKTELSKDEKALLQAAAEEEAMANKVKEAGTCNDNHDNDANAKGSGPHNAVCDLWKWTDKEQVEFRDVERVDVNDEDARHRITQARENGTPVCLVGSKGWAQFASRWLTLRSKDGNEKPMNKAIGLENCKLEADSFPDKPSKQAAETTDRSTNVVNLAIDKALEETELGSAAEYQQPLVNAVADGQTLKESKGSLPIKKDVVTDLTSEAFSVHSVVSENSDDAKLSNETAESGENISPINKNSHDNDAINAGTGLLDASKAETHENGATCPDAKGTAHSLKTPSPDLLDLALDWELDIDKMVQDLGDEKVPIVRPRYNEHNPIGGTLPFSEFIKHSWPSESQEEDKKKLRIYLHQWQFPLSDVGKSLCVENCHFPLPNDIFGEDLLSYWLSNGVNPFQYIFMGREDTLSKNHKDAGGLAITIAPIVGEKEAILVHRSDGGSCLYHLNADVNKVDLNKYPMLCFARVYKTVVKPGEILLMPQGTYHQCRNLTPCLSYSRFILDTHNLRGFLESLINEDAPEIGHQEVIWNASCELQAQVDKFVNEMPKPKKGEANVSKAAVPADIIRKVDTLRTLRNVCREIGKRYEDTVRVSYDNPMGDSQSESILSKKTYSAELWSQMVKDIDSTLHDVRYRNFSTKPGFRGRLWKSEKLKLTHAKLQRTAPKTGYEAGMRKLPLVSEESPPLPLNVKLSRGDKVEVNLYGRRVLGEIQHVQEEMRSALMQYDELSDLYNEYVPLGCLRLPQSGESTTEILPEHVTPSRRLVHRQQHLEYHGTVLSSHNETFCFLSFEIGGAKVQRWLPLSAILAVKQQQAVMKLA